MGLNLEKLFLDVLYPEKDEKILVAADLPHGEIKDTPDWKERRKMAAEWHAAFEKLSKKIGFTVLPLVNYPATGAHNSDLPLDKGEPIQLKKALNEATLALYLTEFSASAFLLNWAKNHRDFRAVSMPMIVRRMEKTGLSADYKEVAKRCTILRDVMKGAMGASVEFSTGHKWFVDLRYREVKMDDGQLPRKNSTLGAINLPSGETFMAPYEGERGEPSRTQGEIPVKVGKEIILFKVKFNRIFEVVGEGPEAEKFRKFFEEDDARRNIAEFAFGTNPKAVVWGNALEDEKAGFHWAYGRSDHIGGITSPSKFKSPATVVHFDIVYAKDSPIQVENLTLEYADKKKQIIKNKNYTVF